MDIFYNEKNEIINHKIKVCNVYISKNFSYENINECENNKYFKSIKKILNLKKSKDMVTKLMLYFNHYVAKTLSAYKKGIYKSLNHKNTETQEDVPKTIPQDIYQM